MKALFETTLLVIAFATGLWVEILMQASNPLLLAQVVSGIGASLLFVVFMLWIFTIIFPLKITILETADCKYNDKERDYIITVNNMTLYAKRTVILRSENEYIILKDIKEKYFNLDVYGYTVMQKGEIRRVDIHFATEIDIEGDIEQSPLRDKKVEGQIVIGRCKSKFFPIQRVNELRDGDITITREIQK